MIPWKVLSESVLLDRKWLRVRQQRVLLPNGHVIDEFHLLDGASWAAVLPITDDGQVVLVEQYRHGLGRPSLELPAGVIEPGEPPESAARRELLEETGWAASGELELLMDISPEPARHTYRAWLFAARGVHYQRAAEPERSEQLTVRLVPGRELVEMACRGEVQHGVHVGAILMAARRGML